MTETVFASPPVQPPQDLPTAQARDLPPRLQATFVPARGLAWVGHA